MNVWERDIRNRDKRAQVGRIYVKIILSRDYRIGTIRLNYRTLCWLHSYSILNCRLSAVELIACSNLESRTHVQFARSSADVGYPSLIILQLPNLKLFWSRIYARASPRMRQVTFDIMLFWFSREIDSGIKWKGQNIFENLLIGISQTTQLFEFACYLNSSEFMCCSITTCISRLCVIINIMFP